MRQIVSISSATAAKIVEIALAEAQRHDAAVCIVVLDEAGRFVAGRCVDGATNAAFDVAFAKARHAANFRRPTKFQEDLLVNRGLYQILAVPGMLPLEGGVPIEVNGNVVGAIGVSGAASEIDGMIATVAAADAFRFE